MSDSCVVSCMFTVGNLARPLAESRSAGCNVLLFVIFSDFCQTNYLKIYQTDLRQIFRFGRTVAVDDQPETSFYIPQETVP